jgi:ParB family chromosome partitioning protein
MNGLPTGQDPTPITGSPDLRLLPIDELHPDESQPRRELNGSDTTSEFRTIDGLAQSIRERGILQPLRVMSLASGGYQIQSGHRRHAAAQMAGLQTVPCVIIRDDGDSVGQFIDQVTENTQRKSMTSNEMSEAVQTLLQKGLSQAEVSRKLGVTESTVSMLTRLLKLPPAIREAFDKGLIESARTAYDLERLPKDLQEHILSNVGRMVLTQTAVREAKRAWDSNGLKSRHPFQAPAVSKDTDVSQATIEMLKSCLDDGRQDRYTQATIELDRDAFFGDGWRNCPPFVQVTLPPQSTKVELAGISIDDAFTFINVLYKITGTDGPPNPLGMLEPTNKQLADWINAEITKVIALEKGEAARRAQSRFST